MSIESGFFDLVNALPYPVANPNVTFTPPKTGFWLEADVFRGSGQDITTGDMYINEGICQINVCTYAKTGIIGAMAVADSIVYAIPKGTIIDGPVVINKRPIVLSYILDDTKLMVPVSFSYKRI